MRGAALAALALTIAGCGASKATAEATDAGSDAAPVETASTVLVGPPATVPATDSTAVMPPPPPSVGSPRLDGGPAEHVYSHAPKYGLAPSHRPHGPPKRVE